MDKLREPRDLHIARTAFALTFWALPVSALFFANVLPWWAAFFWLPLFFAKTAGRYTLMLHAICHRPLYKPEYAYLEGWVPYVLGPFWGQTPGSFYAHHIGMHHPENNLAEDLSTTMPYQRDTLAGFVHYWARFFFVGTVHLIRYFRQRERDALLYRFVRGEVAWYVGVAVLLWLNTGAAMVVFVVPFVLMRFFMMMGNWGQHAFVDERYANSGYGNSTCIINVKYNHMCLNDGYHVVHHLKATMHWTEMPTWYLDNIEEFGKHDALVFDGISGNQEVWWLLMTQQWERLASAVVDLPGAPVRTLEQKVAWLQHRARHRMGAVRGIFELAPPPPVAA